MVMLHFQQLVEKLKNYNDQNPECKGMAFLQFYDDGSGEVRCYDEHNDYDRGCCEILYLIENY
jgi:hypothetical protein